MTDHQLPPELELTTLNASRRDSVADAVPSHGPILGHIDTQAQSGSKQTLVFLNGLRGLAALLVYIYHNVSWFYNPDDIIQDGFGYENGSRMLATLPFVRVFFTGGASAVSIFFVLSGFVLSCSPLRMLRNGRNPLDALLSSAIRRPLRLYAPPIAISLIMVVCLQLPIAPLLSWPGSEDNIFLELRRWLIEIVLALNPFEEHSPHSRWFPYDPPVWTMPVEFQGSIFLFSILALSVRLGLRARTLLFSLAGVILLLVGAWVPACFMAGVVLAVVHLHDLDEPYLSRLSPRARFIVTHGVFIVAWYLLSQVANGDRDPKHSSGVYGWYWLTTVVPPVYRNTEYWRFWQSIGAALLTWTILRIHWLQNAFASLHYLGRVSFSLYLVHTPVLWIISDRFYRFFGFRRHDAEMDSWFDNWVAIPDVGPRGLTTGFLFCQAFLFPATMVLSHYSTVYIDEPSTVLAKWFSAKVMGALGKNEIRS